MMKSTLLVDGLSRPVAGAMPPGLTNILWIAEQGNDTGIGRIRQFDLTTGIFLKEPLLEVAHLPSENEQGLLGFCCDLEFASNGHLFVSATLQGTGGVDSVITRYRVSGNPPRAEMASALDIFRVRQPYWNHNGGWIGFSPRDGMLYFALGDGGSEGDPDNRGQDLNDHLGKILRLDVRGADAATPYRIPADNPFTNATDKKKEIWAYGVRNPWRNSFDRETADFWIADVGQDRYEEINFQPASSHGGENYGWKIREGLHPTNPQFPGTGSFVDPIHEYNHQLGKAVVGGYVYRGSRMPEMRGSYFFADYYGKVWTLRRDAENGVVVTDRTSALFPNGAFDGLSAFIEDAAGELYILAHDPGALHRIDPI